MDSVVSSLRFIDYSISNVLFKRNYNVVPENIELEFDFTAHALMSEDKTNAKFQLDCSLFQEDFDNGQNPFYLSCTIIGDFECNGKFNVEDLQLNAMSILLPYLRSFITSFTSQSGIPPIIIPPINVYNYFKINTDHLEVESKNVLDDISKNEEKE
ncbi:hypothetical protein [Psychrobacillus psychrotolerans]|uniref:hypothetical protein n=1 Tax=Psychrobacillus psychrotolerans TaxID=126156 RepID=UPI003315E258